jgi:hypothetical protein
MSAISGASTLESWRKLPFGRAPSEVVFGACVKPSQRDSSYQWSRVSALYHHTCLLWVQSARSTSKHTNIII